MHITLYRKYRPNNFEEVAGEQEIIKTIKSSLKSNKLAHAYLFTGPRGVGKTTVARLIAKGVNCLTNGITDTPCNQCGNCKEIAEGSFMDMIEIDAASNRGIDEIRELKEKINYKPSRGRKKVYIIDEVHMLTKEAFNALLKTLEEPPEHVLFILATTEPDKILPTIISRCQRYDFKLFSQKDMTDRLRYIAEKEKISFEESALEAVYEASGGSMRDSISILERVSINSVNEKIDRYKVENILGVTSYNQLNEFLEEIKLKNKKECVKKLEKLWENSHDIELFFKDLAKLCKTLMQKNELSIELGLRIIGSIFDSLAIFKFEEDKRLVGYVLIDKLLSAVSIDNRDYKKVEIPPKESMSTINLEKNDVLEKKELEKITLNKKISIDDIKKHWNSVLKQIKKEKISLIAFLIGGTPKRIEENVLYISFNYENSFSEQQIKKVQNLELLSKITSEIFETKIIVRCEINNIGNRKEDTLERDHNFTEKIVNFFGGEVLE
ncbi:MAG: DNA polymerase III subunit gamma/tau [Fusobacteriaceae bacterium]